MNKGSLSDEQFEALLAVAAETARRPLEWDPRDACRDAGSCVEKIGIQDELIGLLVADPVRINERIGERFRTEAMDRLCWMMARSVAGDDVFMDAAEAINREARMYAQDAGFPAGLPTPRQKGEALLLLRFGGAWDPALLWSRVCPEASLVTPRRLSEVLRGAGIRFTDDEVSRDGPDTGDAR